MGQINVFPFPRHLIVAPTALNDGTSSCHPNSHVSQIRTHLGEPGAWGDLPPGSSPRHLSRCILVTVPPASISPPQTPFPYGSQRHDSKMQMRPHTALPLKTISGPPHRLDEKTQTPNHGGHLFSPPTSHVILGNTNFLESLPRTIPVLTCYSLFFINVTSV